MLHIHANCWYDPLEKILNITSLVVSHYLICISLMNNNIGKFSGDFSNIRSCFWDYYIICASRKEDPYHKSVSCFWCKIAENSMSKCDSYFLIFRVRPFFSDLFNCRLFRAPVNWIFPAWSSKLRSIWKFCAQFAHQSHDSKNHKVLPTMSKIISKIPSNHILYIGIKSASAKRK